MIEQPSLPIGAGTDPEFPSLPPPKRVIAFRVNGEPKAMGRPRAFLQKLRDGRQFVRAYNPTSAESFKTAVAAAAKDLVPFVPMQGPIKLDILFWMPRPKAHMRKDGSVKDSAPTWHIARPDRDNLEKTVMDALTGIGMWRDDSQVCCGPIAKRYGAVPGAEITIEEL